MSQTDALNNFTVGEIEVSPQHNTVRYNAHVITVQPKVMAVFYYLAQNQTRVVGNEELLQSVWSGRIVTLASVQKSINALRSALAELVGEQEFVAYFSKRGYQLILPVTWQASAPLPADEAAAEQSVITTTAPSPFATEAESEPTTTHPQAFIHTSAHKRSKLIFWGIILALGALTLAFIVEHSRGTSSLSGNDPESKRAPLTAIPSITPASEPNPATNSIPAWQTISTYLPASANAHHTSPNPDGNRAAYLRESELADGTHQSDLMIRDNTGLDWLLARSNSTWVDLAWSPSGRALAALEIYRADGVFSEPNFYQTPQYLYNFHLFTLDLKGQHLLEKNLLSQWQGKVNSITWWDENTLEFVATMGASGNKERYRYGVTDQTLTTLGPLTSGYQPLISRVRDKITALISYQQDKSQVEFLDEQQHLIRKHAIDAAVRDLTWAPDTNAVYAMGTNQNKIQFLPINGAPSTISLPSPLNEMAAGSLSDLKLDSSGKSLFITATTQPTLLDKYSPQGLKHITDITQLIKTSVVYAPTADALIYATQQNSQTLLWLVKKNQTEALYKIEGQIQTIVWPSTDVLIIKANHSLASLDLKTRQWNVLIKDAQDIEPLDYNQATQTLVAIKSINGVRNIWRINLDSQQTKQLTFGEVGSARSWNNSVYFQYSNQKGLWKLNAQDPNHSAINDQLPQHSQLLGMVGNDIYFVTGGACHESEVLQLNLTHNTLSTYLKRQDTAVVSFDFSAAQGVLQSPCSPKNYTSYEVRAP